MDRCIENCFEFLKGQSICTATVSEKRLINKFKKLIEKYPDTFELCCENEDGSIVVHFPVKNLAIRAPKKKLTEEEKENIKQRFNKP